MANIIEPLRVGAVVVMAGAFAAACADSAIDAVDLSAGRDYTCAVRASGAVVCWGNNYYGQLGDGTRMDRWTPVVVSGLTDAVEVSAGSAHTCARRSTGGVACWGANYYGQLGDGTRGHSMCDLGGGTLRDCSLTPVEVSGLTDAVAISVGGSRTCALRASGGVVCWGEVITGTASDARCDFGLCSLTPIPVWGLADAVEMSLGDDRWCAARESGAVVCWGGNDHGELGDGTAHSIGAVVAVSGLTDAVEVSLGNWHTCARRAPGAVVCWGANYDGQLGDGASTHSTCWPGIDCSLVPVAVSGLTDAVEVSASQQHTCARRASGAVVCWGYGGELGDGSISHSTCPFGDGDCSLTPVAVSGLTDAVEVSGGDVHTCARRASGAVVCWGRNMRGQLGDGTIADRATPVTVAPPP